MCAGLRESLRELPARESLRLRSEVRRCRMWIQHTYHLATICHFLQHFATFCHISSLSVTICHYLSRHRRMMLFLGCAKSLYFVTMRTWYYTSNVIFGLTDRITFCTSRFWQAANVAADARRVRSDLGKKITAFARYGIGA